MSSPKKRELRAKARIRRENDCDFSTFMLELDRLMKESLGRGDYKGAVVLVEAKGRAQEIYEPRRCPISAKKRSR